MMEHYRKLIDKLTCEIGMHRQEDGFSPRRCVKKSCRNFVNSLCRNLRRRLPPLSPIRKWMPTPATASIF